MNLMLVDNDPGEQHLFLDAIDKLGLDIKVLFAANNRELFECLEENPDVNLIFLDINMPETDGKACLKQLKADERFSTIPVLIYSVSQSLEDIDEVFASGAHYYAIKPYANTNFIETLKLVFGIDWTQPQPLPPRENFVINLAFT